MLMELFTFAWPTQQQGAYHFRYIYAQRYRDHHDDEFIRRCERVRRQFILTSALCGLVVVSLIALMIWH